MFSQLKRSIPDLRLHKTHQPLIGKLYVINYYSLHVVLKVYTYKTKQTNSNMQGKHKKISSGRKCKNTRPTKACILKAINMKYVLDTEDIFLYTL